MKKGNVTLKLNSLKEILNYQYTVELTKISEVEGGGYTACIPELGRYYCIADGETIEEVTNKLETMKREIVQSYYDRAIPIPTPKERYAQYSGKFVVRVPKELHYTISRQAEENRMSMNQYLIYLLTQAVTVSQSEQENKSNVYRKKNLKLNLRNNS